MIREKITHKDFHRIAKENEYFLWHFLQKDQHKTPLAMSSLIEESRDINTLSMLLNDLDIPYFESYTEDSIDFLAGLGFDYNKLYNGKPVSGKIPPMRERFSPIVIGFKKFTKVLSTLDNCYCADGVTQILSKMDERYLEQIMINLEKNPD